MKHAHPYYVRLFGRWFWVIDSRDNSIQAPRKNADDAHLICNKLNSRY
jgi:hypothetical protein